MQWRFDERHGGRALRLLDHKRVRAAYDFFMLRAGCGEVDRETASWWTEIQTMPIEERNKLLNVKPQGRRRRGGRGRRARQREISDVVV